MASVISSTILRTQSDERLVALSRTGHQRAFEAIVERYRPELTRSIHRFLPSASVEDVMQQTNLEAWKALSGGTEVRELRAWLHRIARNAAIAVASRGYDYDELKDALQIIPGPEDELERREAVRRALRGIAELPERQRDALLAVAVGGRSHAEVALDLGITDTAARQLVRRARVSLLALASVVTPPQLVLWAARAGHTVMAGTGHTAVAGKAAAGVGFGGSLTGPALKLGAVAIAVGGVAAGVAPIRHALVPPPPPAPLHHRHHARAPLLPTYLAASPGSLAGARGVRRVPITGAPNGTAPVRRHRGHHRSSLGANSEVNGVPAAPDGAPAPAPSPVPTATPPPIPTSFTAPPKLEGVAALIAWALAHPSQAPTGASASTFYGWTVGRSTPGSPGQASPPAQSAPAAQTGGNPSPPQCTPGAATTPGQTRAPGGTAGHAASGSPTGCSSTGPTPGSTSPADPVP